MANGGPERRAGAMAGGAMPDRSSGALTDLMRQAVFVQDESGAIILWGPEAQLLFGYPPERALGQQAADLLLPDGPSGTAREWQRTARTGREWAGMLPARHADGHTRLVEVRSRPAPAPGGAVRILSQAADAGTLRELASDLALSTGLINQSPVALGLFDTDLNWRRVNPALARLHGVPASELIGRSFGATLTETDVSGVGEVLRRVLETGRPVIDHRTTGRTPADPDRDHVWSASFYRLDEPDGRPLGVAMSAIDVSERVRANNEVARARVRLALIAEAGTKVGTTLDLRQTAHELVRTAVPRYADLAGVDILDAVLGGGAAPPVQRDGSAVFRLLAFAGGEGTALEPAARDIGGPVTFGPARISTQAVRHSRAILLAKATAQGLRRLTRDEREAQLLESAGVHSVLVTPLIARGEVLGTLTLMRTTGSRAFDEEDRELAGELAARAAISVDNARLYTRERNTALTLQRSLLPQLPQERSDIDIAYRYRPAVSEVGGDWIDVLRLPGGRFGLVVGDVMGKGVRAAAIMGQLRSTIRALARMGVPPAELLGHLDGIAEFLGDSIATCLYAECDPRAGWCELASAGHLPPVLVQPDGRGELLRLPRAVPLGVGGVPFLSVRLRLAPGATLALFTDGLVEERGHSIDEGLRAVLRLLEGPAGSLEETCDTVLGIRGRDTAPQDDVALLLARVHRGGAAGEEPSA
ncbi:SpoIIE family protein phosphatase [Streptomyces xiamenensis]